MTRRVLLNCWLAAMWIWIAGHCRHYVWVTRSHSFRGKVPHFGNADARRWRSLRVIEYIPPKRELWTPRNKLILFDGEYRVWHLRLVAVRRFKHRNQALEDSP